MESFISTVSCKLISFNGSPLSHTPSDESSDTADVPAWGKINNKNVHLLCARHYANSLMSHNPHAKFMRHVLPPCTFYKCGNWNEGCKMSVVFIFKPAKSFTWLLAICEEKTRLRGLVEAYTIWFTKWVCLQFKYKNTLFIFWNEHSKIKWITFLAKYCILRRH